MSGKFATGCLPLTKEQERKQAGAIANAVSLPEYAWQNESNMPVIRWDDEFEKWLDRRIALADKYRKKGYCLLPWEIFNVLPHEAKKSKIYSWNQGSLPSCSMHGAVHAFQTSLLVSIALGSPLAYESFNPLYPFYLARGGNLAGGLDIYTTAEWANEKGFYPVSLVGDDNLHIDRQKIRDYSEDALRFQSGIVYIEGDYERNIVKACRALCSVCFGSGRYFQSARTDSNGIKVMSGVGYGGHAQCFTGWREVNGEEYIYDQNSWGDQYGQSAEGEPASGSWLGEEERAVYWRDIENYGHPYLVFIEGELRGKPSLVNDFELPNYPRKWIA